jgi:DNA-binding FadR family transcriptional regulator
VNAFLGDVTPVVVRSAAAQVADQIVAAIREERLKPDDRLPAERDLAQRFGVSRPTIREALAALELAGIVRSYKGKGTIVIANAPHIATWGVEILPPQVFEARITIEPQLAALAAEKRYAEDVAELHAALKALEDEHAATGTYKTDFAVHRAIARAARNPLLQRALEESLSHSSTPLWEELSDRAFGPSKTIEDHLDDIRHVVGFIENGKAREAAERWRAHLLFFRDEMLGKPRHP